TCPHPVRVLRPGGSGPTVEERPADPLKPERRPPPVGHRPHHVRRSHQAGGGSGEPGEGTFHGTGLQVGDPEERPAGRGPLLRSAGRSLRSKVEGSSGLPGPCVGGAGETGREGATDSRSARQRNRAFSRSG